MASVARCDVRVARAGVEMFATINAAAGLASAAGLVLAV